jgi:hypothetical protein
MTSGTHLNTAVGCAASIVALWFAALPPRLLAAQQSDAGRPVLPVPVCDSAPVIDGRLDEPCWKKAAVIGALTQEQGQPAKSLTKAFVLRDAERLYVGVTCQWSGPAPDEKGPAKPPMPENGTGTERPVRSQSHFPEIAKQEHVALLIDSNHDQNSYYLFVLTQQGTVEASYNEHWPPWHDPTWNRRKPRFQCRTATGEGSWNAEFALPFEIFDKNKTLTSEIGFNIRRYDMRARQTQCWRGVFSNPADAGLLTGIPARRLPAPPLANYAGVYRLDGGYGMTFNMPPDTALAGPKDRPIRLGPGSTHPGTTGEVRIELEGFLLGGNVHARALIWDLAVDEKKGELYVLSAARRKSDIQLRVFDRQGAYLRTIMPFNPTLPADSVRDLCRNTVVEGSDELVVPKLFEMGGTEASLYGQYWHLPQSMAIAPNGDLIMSNLFKRTLWRMRPDGSLPSEGWTSIYDPCRNEPFESTGWLIGEWHAQGLKPYLSYGIFCLPGMCFDRQGHLYVSGGVFTALSQFYSTNWEVPGRGQGEAVWKYRLLEGTKLEPVRDFRFNGTAKVSKTGQDHLGFEGQPGADDAHFNQPCGLAAADGHLVVADSGNNRLQVFEEDGRLVASIQSYQQEGQQVPLRSPTALAMDRQQRLYVLALIGSERRLLKLTGWREPRLLAASEPLHADTIRIAVDRGVDPPLVWIANGKGPGTLLRLAGHDLALTGKWADDNEKLSSPGQYGYLPVLNIDPQTGELYVEDDSYYHRGLYGAVYRLDQSGKILKKWPPLLFNEVRNWDGLPIYAQAHAVPVFRCPEEPLFLDSLFGKDGRIYRWRRSEKTVEILRFDRAGKPIPFMATGSNALVVDQRQKGSQRNYFVYRGMDVDAQGNVYYVNSRNSVDVYDSNGDSRSRDLLQLMDTRGLLVDEQGTLYVLSCPRAPTRTDEGYWTSRDLYLSRYAPSGGKPIWSRRWEGILGRGAGRVAWMQTTCVCLNPRLHQALDEKGYLFVANKFSVLVIDCKSGRRVGEFGSYGNVDCLGKGSAYPHPELPFGTIAALAVWKDQLFVVDAMNARIAKCRIIYRQAGKTEP